MLKAERKLLEFIEKNIFVISVFFITLLSIGMRFLLKDFHSQDATYALLPWYEEIKSGGGLKSLANQVGNYNVLYQFFIAIMTYIPIQPIYAYKILSCIFDYALAIAVAYLVYDIAENNKKWKAFLAYTLVVVSPIVVINSSVWAQCDSIYVFFIVVAIILLFREKYAKSFVFLGISFACKLQAVFILPLFLFVYFVKKKFSVLNFSFIPAVMLLSGVPAIIFGRNIFDIFKVYWEQSDTYKSMFLKYPSFWALFCAEGKVKHYETLKGTAILLAVAVLAILMIIWIIGKTPINKTNLIYIAFMLSYACVLFLPAMHERYGYIYEILSIVIVFVNRKTILLMVSLWIISLCSYADFVFNVRTDMRTLAVFNCVLFAVYTLVLMKEMYKEKISLK